jgi:hypothetical protein
MYRSLRSTSLMQLLLVCVIALGLFAAPFAEAGTLAVNQVAMASTPNPDLHTQPAIPQSAAMTIGLRSTDEGSVNILSEEKPVIGGIAMATFASASILPSVAISESRSCSSSTTLNI